MTEQEIKININNWMHCSYKFWILERVADSITCALKYDKEVFKTQRTAWMLSTHHHGNRKSSHQWSLQLEDSWSSQ